MMLYVYDITNRLRRAYLPSRTHRLFTFLRIGYKGTDNLAMHDQFVNRKSRDDLKRIFCQIHKSTNFKKIEMKRKYLQNSQRTGSDLVKSPPLIQLTGHHLLSYFQLKLLLFFVDNLNNCSHFSTSYRHMIVIKRKYASS